MAIYQSGDFLSEVQLYVQTFARYYGCHMNKTHILQVCFLIGKLGSRTDLGRAEPDCRGTALSSGLQTDISCSALSLQLLQPSSQVAKACGAHAEVLRMAPLEGSLTLPGVCVLQPGSRI